MMESKADAFAFLAGLEGRLKANLPPPAEMRASVDAIWNKPAHAKTPQERLACRENVFLYHFALPEIFEHVRSAVDFDVGAAVRSLGCEYYQKFPQYAGSNGLRRAGYPFAKKMGLASRTVMTTWKRARRTFPLNQTFPDLALFEPFPFRIVFDGKFFDQDSLPAGESALVEGVYEVAHYRGLPRERGCSYDFGCLLAYDASDDGYMEHAWQTVAQKSLFWEDANVFVAIIRGN